MPRVGSCRISTCGWVAMPTRQNYLLLVAAAQRSHLLRQAGHANIQLAHIFLGEHAAWHAGCNTPRR